MERFSAAVLVRNQYGVLNRVTSMFRRRQFNIASLNVSETESPEFSRITVQFDGEPSVKEQLINQLYKLPDVVSIKELDIRSIKCETLLIKMENDPANRRDILDAADAFGAKTIDYSRTSIVLQLTDIPSRIDEFVMLLSPCNVLEICRSGVVSLERGDTTLRKAAYL